MDQGPVTIEQAYDELSHEAFAVWIRLMVATDHELEAGRYKIANVLGYSEGRSNEVLRELKHKGFLSLIKGDHPGIPTSIQIARRAMISGRNRFIKLRSIETLQSPRKNPKPTDQEDDESDNPDSGIARELDNLCNVQLDGQSLCFPSIPPTLLNNSSSGAGQKTHKLSYKTKQKCILPIPDIQADSIQILGKPAFKTKRKFTSEDGGLGAHESDRETTHNRDSDQHAIREKYKQAKLKEHTKRKRVNQLHIQKSGTSKTLEWDKLDQRGQPAITFEPTEDVRTEWVNLLEGPGRNLKRQQLLVKLGIEFSRIYTRYRRMLQRQDGKVANYLIPEEGQKKYCRKAGMLCILAGVTPGQAIEYWHINIKDFANKDMDLPPLWFFTATNIYETVQAAVSKVEHEKKRKFRSGDFQKPVAQNHGFSDVKQLDKRLRSGLEWEGFDTRKINDRYLLTIQKAAMTIAKGRTLFVGAEIKPMVDWAVKHLYGGNKKA